MRYWPVALTLSVFVAASGCAAGTTVRASTDEPAGYAAPRDGSSLQLRRIGQWTNSGVQESRRLVIRDANGWDAFWNDMNLGERPPVDFTRETVIAVSAGTKPSGGHEIRIDNVSVDADRLTIEVVSTTPGPNCVTTSALTQPVDVVIVPASAVASWSFVERDETRDCR